MPKYDLHHKPVRDLEENDEYSFARDVVQLVEPYAKCVFWLVPLWLFISYSNLYGYAFIYRIPLGSASEISLNFLGSFGVFYLWFFLFYVFLDTIVEALIRNFPKQTEWILGFGRLEESLQESNVRRQYHLRTNAQLCFLGLILFVVLVFVFFDKNFEQHILWWQSLLLALFACLLFSFVWIILNTVFSEKINEDDGRLFKKVLIASMIFFVFLSISSSPLTIPFWGRVNKTAAIPHYSLIVENDYFKARPYFESAPSKDQSEVKVEDLGEGKILIKDAYLELKYGDMVFISNRGKENSKGVEIDEFVDDYKVCALPISKVTWEGFGLNWRSEASSEPEKEGVEDEQGSGSGGPGDQALPDVSEETLRTRSAVEATLPERG